MTLKEKLDARQIVMKAGMSASPGYYSGRGAINSDLNNKILERVYQGIQGEYGKDASQQFVQMVADIPKLSATDFLLTLYRLESNEWEWDKKMFGNEKGIYPEDRGSALGTICSVLGGMHNRDETDYIRGQFLRRHNIKVEEEKGYFLSNH